MFVFLLMFLSSTLYSNGQYREKNSFSTVSTTIESGNYNNLVSSKITRCNGKAYISWTIVNDTIEGYFAIYKSKDFKEIKTIDYVKIPKGLVLNVPIIFSVTDSIVDNTYDTYHIIKMDQNTTFFASNHIVFHNSIANVQLPEQDFYTEQKSLVDSKKDLYSQGF